MWIDGGVAPVDIADDGLLSRHVAVCAGFRDVFHCLAFCGLFRLLSIVSPTHI